MTFLEGLSEMLDDDVIYNFMVFVVLSDNLQVTNLEIPLHQSKQRQYMSKPKCPKCGESVYLIDKLEIGDEIWHEGCLSCADCKAPLNLGNYKSLEGKKYCVSHYKKRTDPNKVSVLFNGQDKKLEGTKMTSSRPKCEACGEAVYITDQLECGEKFYHPTCFKCKTCKSGLNLGNYKSLNGFIYCQTHYKEETNPHNISEMKKSTISTDKKSTKPICPVCNDPVYPLDRLDIGDLALHSTCLKCSVCKSALNTGNYKSLNGVIYCVSHYKKVTENQRPQELLQKDVKPSSKPKCPGCGENVYQLDMLAVGESDIFHTTCFKCSKCKTHYKEALGHGGNMY
jgi:cysteine/glycine-rich protein